MPANYHAAQQRMTPECGTEWAALLHSNVLDGLLASTLSKLRIHCQRAADMDKHAGADRYYRYHRFPLGYGVWGHVAWYHTI